jgi:hypothetical protein
MGIYGDTSTNYGDENNIRGEIMGSYLICPSYTLLQFVYFFYYSFLLVCLINPYATERLIINEDNV